MSEPRELLVGLLDYIKEQAKVIDPRGFVLGAAGVFQRRRKDVAGLFGVEFDLTGRIGSHLDAGSKACR